MSNQVTEPKPPAAPAAAPTPAAPEAAEEWASHEDDRVIGRAIRWSAVAVVLIGCGVAGAIYWATRKPPAPPPRVTQIAAPVVPTRAETHIPSARFTDVTSAAGLTFVHDNGAYGDKLLPETMGGGVAFFDCDGDGDQDLLFVNGTRWAFTPSSAKVPAKPKHSSLVLYTNDGTGEFTDVTAGSGLEAAGSFYGMGCAVGDYDNDGHVDVFVTGVGGYRLFRNTGGGKFTDVTQKANVAGAKDDWGTSAAFFDYDRDGKLDLFVCNYIRWSPEIDREVGYSLVGIGRAYGPPNNFEGAFARLYHNRADGTFADVSAAAGIQVKNTNALGVPAGKSLGVSPVDLDGDGWLDLVVANDTVQNFVFRNRRDGTFEECGALCGVAFDNYGNTRGAMGIDTARFRNDDTLGIGIGNFANEMIALYVSRGGGAGGSGGMLFTDDAIPEGVGPASRLLLKFGLFFFDYDLDGWEDLLTSNGHLEEEISKVQQSQHYRQPAQLFWNGNAHDAGFIPVALEKAGPDLFKPIVGRGSAFADVDGDGDQDVVLTQIAGPPLLLRNDQSLGRRWLRLKLVGKGANRDAVGAQVRVTVGGKTLWRQVMPTRSYLSQSELPVTIGLGDVERPNAVEIIWPDGSVQKVEGASVGKLTVIEQSSAPAGKLPA